MRVLVLVGRIASGKTSVGNLIASRLPDVGVVSVSSSLAQLAQDRGVDTSSRRELQRFGLDIIEREPSVLARAIARAAPPKGVVVIDGLRSSAVLTLLTDSVDGDMRCVYLEAPGVVRKARYEARGGAEEAPFEQVDSHSIEAHVDTMRSLADVVVDASGTLEEVYVRVVEAIIDS